MKRWAWSLGAVLALIVALGLLWPRAGALGSRESRASREAVARGGEARGAGGAASGERGEEPGATSRGGRTLRGLVTSLTGQLVAGASIVALPHVKEDTFGARLCRFAEVGEMPLEGWRCSVDRLRVDALLDELRSQAPVPLRATTDARGRFELPGLLEGDYEVWAESPNGVAVQVVSAETQELRLALEEGMTLRGVTRGEEDVLYPEVPVVLVTRDYVRHFEAVSDAEGRFTFGTVPTTESLALAVREGLLPAWSPIFAESGNRRVRLLLFPWRVLEGRVVRQGRGVPGAEVHADSRRTVTDARGHFVFDGVLPLGYTLQARAGREVAVVRVLVDDAATTTRVVLELQPCAVLEGQVTDEGGRPLAGATVKTRQEHHLRSSLSVTADAQGRYRFDCLLPEGFDTWAQGAGFQRRELPEPRPLAPGETRRLDWVLGEAAPFTGRIVDSEGRGIPGASLGVSRITITEENAEVYGKQVQVQAGEDGHFTVDGLAPGPYRVGIRVEKGFQSHLERIEVPLTDARFVLEPAWVVDGVVMGTVVDEQGQPLEGVRVDAEVLGESYPRSVRTLASGEFRMRELPRGPLRLIASHQGSRNLAQVRHTKDVEIQGPEPVRVDFTLGAGLTVSGQVVDGTGAPVARAAVTATLEASGERQRRDSGAQDTDEEGRFTLRHLEPGEYELTVHLQDERSSLLRQHSSRVRAGATGLHIVLAPMREVRGRVVHADGSPVREFKMNDGTVEDPQGQFTVPVAPPETLQLAFTAEGLAPVLRELTVEADADVRLPEVVMRRGRAVRGRVLDASTDKPLMGARVSPFEGALAQSLYGPSWLDMTGDDGRFELFVEERGASLVVAEEDHQPVRVPVPEGVEELVVRLQPLVIREEADLDSP